MRAAQEQVGHARPLAAVAAAVASSSSSGPRPRAERRARRRARPSRRRSCPRGARAADADPRSSRRSPSRRAASCRAPRPATPRAAAACAAATAGASGSVSTIATPSTRKTSPARSIRTVAHASRRAPTSTSDRPVGSSTRSSAGGRTKVFSCRKNTVSSPTVMARSPAPIVTFRIGGVDAAPSAAALLGRVGALLQRLLPHRELHREGEAGRVAALLAVGVGQELEDLQVRERPSVPPRSSPRTMRRRRPRPPQRLGVPQHEDVAPACEQWQARSPPPSGSPRRARSPHAAPSPARTSFWRHASSPTRQITGG